MIDYKEIDYKNDTFELFARDFLTEVGFFIESSPDRGADAGKDLLVTEELKGNLNKYRFRWLVSCKHFATRGSSVSEKDETNILERLSSFNADGFMGFYSTLPSSGLNSRLRELRKEGKIKDFFIFDSKLIENYLIRVGYSHLLMRYFPESYKAIRPLHEVLDKYYPIQCDYCGKDLLEALYKEEFQSLIAEVSTYDDSSSKTIIKDIYFACKGKCDEILDERATRKDLDTAWKDISDLAIPLEYLRYVMTMLNQIRSGNYQYEDKAFEKEKNLILFMAQKVLRETTEKEKQRVAELIAIPF